MELHSLPSKSLSWTNSISTSPTTHSTKILEEPKLQPLLTIKLCKKGYDLTRTGLQKQPRKDLSRILRTDAAIRAIEQKANSKKYSNLWPKAVLEALDDAIRRQRWESALKVRILYLWMVFIRCRLKNCRLSFNFNLIVFALIEILY